MFVDVDPKLARLWKVAEPIALEAGLELVDIEHRRERGGAVVRLLLDRAHRPDGPGGVSLDELAAVSRQVSDALDVDESAVGGSYTLEVSSPGINRPLTRPEHFTAFVGKRVHVRTREPLGERHSFRGILESVDSSGIVLLDDERSSHTIPFAAIARANYQHDFSSPHARRGAGRRGARARGR
jgi:ribosome maturation factor RimP